MSKFKQEAFGRDKGTKLALGAGLLSAESTRHGKEHVDDIYWLDIDDIEPNPKNEMSQSNIEEMAELIKLAGGVEENLVGYQTESGKIRLTSGERRYRGAKYLREKEGITVKLPCRIKDFRNYDLPIDDDSKERFAILVTNKYRDKTDADRLIEVRDWEKIIKQLRQKGVKVLELKSGENDTVAMQPIEGEKTRDIIATQTGMTPSQVHRYQRIINSDNDRVKNAILGGTLDLAGAETLAELPEKEQAEFVDTHLKNREKVMKGYEVKRTLRNKEAEDVKLDYKTFEKDMAVIGERLQSSTIELSATEYKIYRECVNKLKKIISDR